MHQTCGNGEGVTNAASNSESAQEPMPKKAKRGGEKTERAHTQERGRKGEGTKGASNRENRTRHSQRAREGGGREKQKGPGARKKEEAMQE